MAEGEHVYAVIATSWADGGPLRGLYADAWDAIRAVRAHYTAGLYESPVPDASLTDGVVYSAQIMGESDTRIIVRRMPVTPAS